MAAVGLRSRVGIVRERKHASPLTPRRHVCTNTNEPPSSHTLCETRDDHHHHHYHPDRRESLSVQTCDLRVRAFSKVICDASTVRAIRSPN